MDRKVPLDMQVISHMHQIQHLRAITKDPVQQKHWNLFHLLEHIGTIHPVHSAQPLHRPSSNHQPPGHRPTTCRAHPDIPTCRDLKIHAARDRCDSDISDISDISDTARVPFFWRSLVPNGCMAGRIKKNNMPGLWSGHRRNQQV